MAVPYNSVRTGNTYVTSTNDLVIDTVDGVAGLVNRPGITILSFGGDLTQDVQHNIGRIESEAMRMTKPVAPSFRCRP